MRASDESGPTGALVVLCTAPSDGVARDLARTLVGEGRVACANLVPGVTSVYRWQGEVHEDAEVLLVLKLPAGGWAGLERRVLELHPYDTPELVALEPGRVEARYLAWLLDEA